MTPSSTRAARTQTGAWWPSFSEGHLAARGPSPTCAHSAPEGEPEGAEEGLSPDQRARVGDANVLLERLCILALKVWHQRGGFVLEHPAARNIFGTPFYWPLKAHYSSIREMLCVRALVAVTGAVWVFAPHCAFADADGGPGEEEGVGMGAQKWSMYLIAREALACFPRLRSATCRHSGHSQHA